MTKISDLHRRWRKDADYKDACDALREFDFAQSLIEATTAARLSQSQLAKKMKTSGLVARIEGERCVHRVSPWRDSRKPLAGVYESSSNPS